MRANFSLDARAICILVSDRAANALPAAIRQQVLDIYSAERASIPEAVIVEVTADAVPDVFTYIRAAHLALADCAAAEVRRTSHLRWHEPAVIEYLRRELSQDLPQPASE